MARMYLYSIQAEEFVSLKQIFYFNNLYAFSFLDKFSVKPFQLNYNINEFNIFQLISFCRIAHKNDQSIFYPI